MKKMLLAVIVTAASLVVTALHPPPIEAQAPSFEVASIKRNNSGDGNVSRGMQPGGMTFVNAPLRQLIIAAYGVQPFQIIGGPAWLASDRFDVVAKADGAPPPEQMNLMLRTLLAERFKLVARMETREMPTYSLVKAREDGRLGPGLKPASVDCGPAGRGRGGPPPPPPGPPPGGGRAGGPVASLGGGCRVMIAPGRIISSGQPIAQLGTLLGNQLGRPVIDKTGLTGGYDFEVSYMPEAGRGGLPTPPPGAPPLPAIDPDAPSLFTALQEQLGLKLESDRGPVDVVVIDSVEPPTED
jgi:uncharacterized protein (TIGR03435 family)